MKKPPTIQELTNYCEESGIPVSVVDPEYFHLWYEEQEPPWSVPAKKKGARRPMTSWKLSVQTWKRNRKDTTSFASIKQREEDYAKKKAVYMRPVKTKPAKSNPESKKLVKKLMKLGQDWLRASRADRIVIKRNIVQLKKDIQKVSDNDLGIGSYL